MASVKYVQCVFEDLYEVACRLSLLSRAGCSTGCFYYHLIKRGLALMALQARLRLCCGTRSDFAREAPVATVFARWMISWRLTLLSVIVSFLFGMEAAFGKSFFNLHLYVHSTSKRVEQTSTILCCCLIFSHHVIAKAGA